MPKLAILTGRRFGRLTVLDRAQSVNERTFWTCICDCGVTSAKSAKGLLNGETSSCGCYGRERRSAAVSAAKRTDDPSYLAMHKRVYRARGKARDHQCANCPAPAFQWAWNHSNPVDGTATVRKGVVHVQFSRSVDDYIPMCRECHRSFDERPLQPSARG